MSRLRQALAEAYALLDEIYHGDLQPGTKEPQVRIMLVLERISAALAEPDPADMAAFGASDAACTLYPGADQQALRQAFCDGAARHALRHHSEPDPGAGGCGRD